MPIATRLVKEVLSDVEMPEYEETSGTYHPAEMRLRYGDWSVGTLAEKLEHTDVHLCGKQHEMDNTLYTSCPHLETNLVCGHLRNTYHRFVRGAVRTAGGIIATSAYVLDRYQIPAAARCIPTLTTLSQRLYQLDGAAFAARKKLEQLSLDSYTNVPDEYRQPALEKLQSVPELQLAIIGQEETIAPDMVGLRDFVRERMRLLLARDSM